jgi:hypothetical protein
MTAPHRLRDLADGLEVIRVRGLSRDLRRSARTVRPCEVRRAVGGRPVAGSRGDRARRGRDLSGTPAKRYLALALCLCSNAGMTRSGGGRSGPRDSRGAAQSTAEVGRGRRARPQRRSSPPRGDSPPSRRCSACSRWPIAYGNSLPNEFRARRLPHHPEQRLDPQPRAPCARYFVDARDLLDPQDQRRLSPAPADDLRRQLRDCRLRRPARGACSTSRCTSPSRSPSSSSAGGSWDRGRSRPCRGSRRATAISHRSRPRSSSRSTRSGRRLRRLHLGRSSSLVAALALPALTLYLRAIAEAERLEISARSSPSCTGSRCSPRWRP